MLVCVKIGVVYLVVFVGYLLEVFNVCIDGLELKVVIIVDGLWINGKVFFMKQIVDEL